MTQGKRAPEDLDMPAIIYATPRGSGCMSGVYVDLPLGDEPRGEHKYVRSDLADELLEALGLLVEWSEASGIQCLPAYMEQKARAAIAKAEGRS